MTLGIYLLIITILGYATVYLRDSYLRIKLLAPLTWLGVLVHESSHALMALVTGGRVEGFKAGFREGYVSQSKSKVPFIGNFLVATAPLFFGLIIVGILNHHFLSSSLLISEDIWQTAQSVFTVVFSLSWESLILILLCLNIGVMIGPSFQDLKNVWPVFIIFLFLKHPEVAGLFSLAIVLVSLNLSLFLVMTILKQLLFRK